METTQKRRQAVVHRVRGKREERRGRERGSRRLQSHIIQEE
jgi:hypothetical protein